MNYRYSLANYTVVLTSQDSYIRSILGELRINEKRNTVGGEGDATGEINIELDEEMWTTEGYHTGAWVHNKNLCKTGKVSINVNQLSKHSVALTRLYKAYYTGDYDGVIITVYDNSATNANAVATCKDCYITKIPAKSFQNEAQLENWQFTCGEIDFVTP